MGKSDSRPLTGVRGTRVDGDLGSSKGACSPESHEHGAPRRATTERCLSKHTTAPARPPRLCRLAHTPRQVPPGGAAGPGWQRSAVPQRLGCSGDSPRRRRRLGLTRSLSWRQAPTTQCKVVGRRGGAHTCAVRRGAMCRARTLARFYTAMPELIGGRIPCPQRCTCTDLHAVARRAWAWAWARARTVCVAVCACLCVCVCGGHLSSSSQHTIQ